LSASGTVTRRRSIAGSFFIVSSFWIAPAPTLPGVSGRAEPALSCAAAPPAPAIASAAAEAAISINFRMSISFPSWNRPSWRRSAAGNDAASTGIDTRPGRSFPFQM